MKTSASLGYSGNVQQRFAGELLVAVAIAQRGIGEFDGGSGSGLQV
jgi:hypothetical protein